MTLVQTEKEGTKEAYVKARERLESEIARSPVELEIPAEGGMKASLERGDIFLHDPADDGKTKGSFAWISAEPSWEKPDVLYIVHLWGPSERHLDILIELCEYGIAAGIGDIPVRYQRSTHPLTVLADQHAGVTFSDDGRFAEATMSQAIKSLTAFRDARRVR